VCVLHSLEGHSLCTAQSREALCVCTAQSRVALVSNFEYFNCFIIILIVSTNYIFVYLSDNKLF